MQISMVAFTPHQPCCSSSNVAANVAPATQQESVRSWSWRRQTQVLYFFVWHERKKKASAATDLSWQTWPSELSFSNTCLQHVSPSLFYNTSLCPTLLSNTSVQQFFTTTPPPQKKRTDTKAKKTPPNPPPEKMPQHRCKNTTTPPHDNHTTKKHNYTTTKTQPHHHKKHYHTTTHHPKTKKHYSKHKTPNLLCAHFLYAQRWLCDISSALRQTTAHILSTMNMISLQISVGTGVTLRHVKYTPQNTCADPVNSEPALLTDSTGTAMTARQFKFSPQ